MKNSKPLSLLFIGLFLLGITSCEKNEVAPAAKGFTSQSLVSEASSGAYVYKEMTQIDLREGWNEFNACNGNTIDVVEGIWRTQYTYVENKQRYTWHFHTNVSNYKLIDRATGVEYVGSYVSNDIITAPFSGEFPIQGTFTQKILLTTPGKGNNGILNWDVHITINANGILTANIDNLRSECQ